MDRQIVYPGAIPLETDILNSNKYAMLGLSKLSEALLGNSGTAINGLGCLQQVAPNMTVRVLPGEFYSMATVDFAAFGSLPLDTAHSILKQGISLDTINFTCPAPGTAGQSINYLIQATYADVDANPVTLPYYNASNPTEAYSGPANTGAAQFTTRKGVCNITLKTGVSAATGSQTTPAPDIGYTGLYVITVAYGATSVIDANISALTTAPFLPSKGLAVGGIQQAKMTTAVGNGTADAITANFTPQITALSHGMILYVRAKLANATTTPTFTPAPGLISPVIITKGNALALNTGDISGLGHWIALQYDETAAKWVLLNPAYGVASLGVNQTPVNALPSRVLNTNYTNTSKAPIFITIYWRTDNDAMQGNIYINNVIADITGSFDSTQFTTARAIIPPGATYKFTATLSGTNASNALITSWIELK